MSIQTLLRQAEDCADAAVDAVHAARGDLLETGLTAYTLSTINAKLTDVVGELHKVRRLLPGYRNVEDSF